MDLKNNRITIGELLRHPGAKALLSAELPHLVGSPYLMLAKGMTLEKVISKWGSHISKDKLQRILCGLEKL